MAARLESSTDSAFSSSDESVPAPASASSASPSTSSKIRIQKARGREANVFDAVAGRVTLNGAIGDQEPDDRRTKRRSSSTAGRYSSRNTKLAPEEVLFRRKNAPTRYTEHDMYWANEDLPDGGRHHLPETSLLKSVHGYASRFYEAAAARLGPRCVIGNRTIDERSMDESALLAFGILLEEASRDVLGKRGDLTFTEASTESGSGAVAKVTQADELSTSVSPGADRAGETVVPKSRRGAKRRKVAKEESPEKQAF